MQTNTPIFNLNQQALNPQTANTPISQPQPNDILLKQQPAKKIKTNNFIVIGLIIFILFIFTIVGILAYQSCQQKKQSINLKITPTPILQPTPADMISAPSLASSPIPSQILSPIMSPTPTVAQTADWQTYENAEYRYKFKYPREYFLKELGSDGFLIKNNDNSENDWLISGGIAKDIKNTSSSTTNSSLYDFAVDRAKTVCAADGTQISLYCDSVIQEQNYTNEHKIKGYIFYLNLVTETFGETHKTNAIKGPIYVINIPKQTDARLIIFDLKDKFEPQDEQNLETMISTFQFVN